MDNTKMMTRSRRTSMRKNLEQHRESFETIESKQDSARSELSSSEISESMEQIGLNQNDVGCQDKQDPIAECKDHECNLWPCQFLTCK